jgi:hypothetical protein
LTLSSERRGAVSGASLPSHQQHARLSEVSGPAEEVDPHRQELPDRSQVASQSGLHLHVLKSISIWNLQKINFNFMVFLISRKLEFYLTFLLLKM